MTVTPIKIGIFEMTTKNALIYNSELLKVFERNNVLVKIFVDDEDDYQSGYDVVCRKYWTVKRLSREISKLDMVLINSQRIPDYLVILSANTEGIPTLYLMHGLYIPHMKRQRLFYIKKLSKSIRYFVYAVMLGVDLKSPSLTFCLLANFIFGYPTRKFIQAFDKLQVSIGLVWAESWEEWHKNHFFMKPKLYWGNIGNPDLSRFVWDEAEGNTITYVYQTLVEDGRIDKNVMFKFYNDLKDICDQNQLNINIKWHPRGSNQLRDLLRKKGFTIVNDGSIPLGKIVIGHYSSLLGAFPLKSVPVVVVELPEHDTPPTIRKVASQVISLEDFSNKSIDFAEMRVTDQHRGNSEFYFGKEPDNMVLDQIVMAQINRFAINR